MTRLFMITALAVFGSATAFGQVTSEPPTTQKEPQVSVPDAGFVRHRSRTRTSRDILANALPAHLQNSICSKKVADGTTKYDIIHDSKPLSITIAENGTIEIKLIRRYTRDDIDELKSKHPELAKQVSDFPTTVDGKAIVGLSFEIETLYTANSADELRTNHPNVHAIFVRYTSAVSITHRKPSRVIEE